MKKRNSVTIEEFKRGTHYKEVAPCCGSCYYLLTEKEKVFCGYTFLRTRMKTTKNSFCGSYLSVDKFGGVVNGISS